MEAVVQRTIYSAPDLTIKVHFPACVGRYQISVLLGPKAGPGPTAPYAPIVLPSLEALIRFLDRRQGINESSRAALRKIAEGVNEPGGPIPPEPCEVCNSCRHWCWGCEAGPRGYCKVAIKPPVFPCSSWEPEGVDCMDCEEFSNVSLTDVLTLCFKTGRQCLGRWQACEHFSNFPVDLPLDRG